MGVYVYTMRKKTAPIYIDGVRNEANFFSYAYKVSWAFSPGRSYSRLVGSSHRRADEAFEAYTGGYVLVGDSDDNEFTVYTAVTRGHWTDTGDFPGTVVGFARRDGKRLVFSLHGEWSTWERGGLTVRVRPIVRDGKIVEETEILEQNLSLTV